MPRLFASILALLLVSCAGERPDVRVAVAANFTEPARELAELFEETTGYRPGSSFGSTGQLYAQITAGAPFDVFLSADTDAPGRLIDQELASAESRLTYALGRIALYTKALDLGDPEGLLREGTFRRLAMANPETAPYGRAALEAVRALGVEESLEGRIVFGNGITQTFQFVETGNAELGFVAMSQVRNVNGVFWAVPEGLYAPIRQDAVLLTDATDNQAAREFMAFLGSPTTQALIESYGYGTAR